MVNLGGQKGVGVAAGMGKEAQVSTHTHHVLGETQIWACSPGSVTSHLCDLGPVGQPVGQHTTHTHTFDSLISRVKACHGSTACRKSSYLRLF